MSRFTVILPEGTVILKNEETGQILRLSAESGPLVLGEIEMSMTLGPRPLEVAGAAHAPAVAAAQAPACELPARPADPLADLPDEAFVPRPETPGTAPLPHPIPGTEGVNLINPYEALGKKALRSLPSGFGPNTGEPFMSPEEDWAPGTAPVLRGIRVLDAPLEALTASDFEQILDAMALRRNNIEGEIEFMEEIEADEEDIRDLERDIEQLDRDLADVVARKEEFDALSKKQAAE